jgi:hypothetical protein
LHTTEGSGWPSYSGGAVAPNFTAYPDPAAKALIWRQHFPITMSSRALMHTRTQPTNGDHVVQVELIGTCVPGGPGLYWPGAPDWALAGVAAFLAWLAAEWGDHLLASTVAWRAYNASGDGQRLSDGAYDAYRGVLGHQHAPQNDHRDPGALNVPRIIELAKGRTAVTQQNPTLQEIQSGILYYPLDKDHVNPVTMLTRTYDAVNTLLARTAGLAGLADEVAAKVAAALPETGSGDGGELTPADVKAAVRAVLTEGTGGTP